MIKLPYSQQEHLQIFPTCLVKRNICVSFWFCVRERPEKYSLLLAWSRAPGPGFFIIWWTLIYTESSVCNSGQYTYVMGLCNFFFVLQDFNDRINSYFRRIAFQGTCFLLASNNLSHKFFLMKVSTIHWNGAAYTCKESWWKAAVEYQIS